MKPSDLIWQYLEEIEATTRGDAQEMFADILWMICDAKMQDSNPSGNGSVIDAMEMAVDLLGSVKIVQEYIDDIEDQDDGFDEDEEEEPVVA